MYIKLCILWLHFNLFYWQFTFQAHELISLLPIHLAKKWLKYADGVLSNAARKLKNIVIFRRFLSKNMKAHLTGFVVAFSSYLYASPLEIRHPSGYFCL